MDYQSPVVDKYPMGSFKDFLKKQHSDTTVLHELYKKHGFLRAPSTVHQEYFFDEWTADKYLTIDQRIAAYEEIHAKLVKIYGKPELDLGGATVRLESWKSDNQTTISLNIKLGDKKPYLVSIIEDNMG